MAEILAVVLTGCSFLVFENVLGLKLPFLIGCVLLWTAYIVDRVRRDRALFAEWGIRTDNLLSSSLPCLAFVVLAAGAIAGCRHLAGWIPLPATSILVFLLYPIWGFLQQFMVQSLIAGNMERLGSPRALTIPVAAVLFGFVHLPDWPLAGLCMAAGAVWTFFFLRSRNLVPLAIAHGFLGALTYYWILERNPWTEMFGG